MARPQLKEVNRMSKINHESITIKPDKRFKLGNIKIAGNTLRGNPETMRLERLDVPFSTQQASISPNPPIVVSAELGDKIKEVFGEKDD
jgi:hypothetical protein